MFFSLIKLNKQQRVALEVEEKTGVILITLNYDLLD